MTENIPSIIRPDGTKQRLDDLLTEEAPRIIPAATYFTKKAEPVSITEIPDVFVELIANEKTTAILLKSLKER